MPDISKLSNKLRELGLNDLETTIYIWLLENNRSTGYRIANQTNKPVANTYKALKSLERKGAILSDNSLKTTYFDTVSIEEFLNKKEREFLNTKGLIIEEAKKLQIRQETGGIFELESAELAFEKAISMINSAETTLLVDCFPAPLAKIKKYLKDKSSGDISIFLKNYCDTEIDNINQIKSENPELSVEGVSGEWMIILKDTTESLIAQFTKDGNELKHCIWTKDSFLSFVLFNGSIFEFSYTEIFDKIYDNKNNKINRIKDLISNRQPIFKYLNLRVGDIHKQNE